MCLEAKNRPLHVGQREQNGEWPRNVERGAKSPATRNPPRTFSSTLRRNFTPGAVITIGEACLGGPDCAPRIPHGDANRRETAERIGPERSAPLVALP